MNIFEIVGLILIFCGIIYTFLRGMGKISEKEQDEIESKIIKVKGGPGLMLISFGVILFLAGMQIGDYKIEIPSNGPTPTPTGSISINSKNPGVSIYIDGNYKGITPTTITLEEGSHNMTAKLTGYRDYNWHFYIKAGEHKSIGIALGSL